MEESTGFWLPSIWQLAIAITLVGLHYINFLRKTKPAIFGKNCTPLGFLFPFKKLIAYLQIQIYQKWLASGDEEDSPRFLPSEEDIMKEQRRQLDKYIPCDMQRIQCVDNRGNSLIVGMVFLEKKSEYVVILRLADGSLYELPEAPRMSVQAWSKSKWECGNLRFDIVEAKKRLRIRFNGLMKKESLNNNNNKNELTTHYVQMNFVWNADGDLFDVRKDWHSSLMSDALAREPWKQFDWKHLVKEQGRGFDQWGAARGLVTVDEEEPIDLNLASLRQRRWGGEEAEAILCRAGLMGLTSNGLAFYIRASCSPIGLTYARFGHVRFPDEKHVPVSDCEILVEEIPMDASIQDDILFSLTANGTFMSGDLKKLEVIPVKGHRFFTRLVVVALNVNGHTGYGIAEIWRRDENNMFSDPFPVNSLKARIRTKRSSECRPLTVTFDDPKAQRVGLTGGKGSSLAFLYANVMPIASRVVLKVPNGFCVTVHAFHMHVEQNTAISESIEALKGLTIDQMENACSKIAFAMQTAPIATSTSTEVAMRLSSMRWPIAVRSSGIGEDGTELSSAGQNTTVLGLYNWDDVASAILECWSSLYSFNSVQYRMEHGLNVVSSMGVVIQEMVDSQTAGVMFTAHPRTLDPRRLFISASFGLGETVVSGAVEPDTIEVLKGKFNEDFTIVSNVPGCKSHKIVLSDDGTKEVTLSDKEALEPCLSISEVRSLVDLGIHLERVYGQPLDLEWAIEDGVVYMLQARPITSQVGWTDHELLHEFDSPIFSDKELLSKANVGEVMPGACSSLFLSTVGLIFDKGPNPVGKISHNHVLLDLHKTTLQVKPSSIDISTRVCDLAVMGHEVTTPEILDIAKRKNGVTSSMTKISNLFGSLMALKRQNTCVKQAEDIVRGLIVPPDGTRCSDLFENITQLLNQMEKLHLLHHCTSRASSTSQILLFLFLSAGKDLTAENLFDIATILSSSKKSVSSGIPIALERLADLIAAHERAIEFVEASPSRAIQLLRKIDESVADLWEVFIEKFGHRGWREFDVATSVWALEPTPVIKNLQSLVQRKIEGIADAGSSERKDPEEKTASQILAELKTPATSLQRLFLRYFIEISLSAVNHREKTKECFITLVHRLRLAYIRLAQQLVAEHKLTRASQIFHLTHAEINEVITGNSRHLLIKASKRQRLWKTWDKLQFPEIIRGLPTPIEENAANALRALVSGEKSVKLSGTVVYTGCIVGRALVASDVNGTNDVQPGDILITYSTDVGWSPLFPLLGGVVTELGGLISHGAVVAREYGLPCIVGVQGVTAYFNSGDMVMLNANAGTIEKISNNNS